MDNTAADLLDTEAGLILCAVHALLGLLLSRSAVQTFIAAATDSRKMYWVPLVAGSASLVLKCTGLWKLCTGRPNTNGTNQVDAQTT